MKKTEEIRLDVAEVKMLKWMSGVTLRGKVRNEHIIGSVKVIEV